MDTAAEIDEIEQLARCPGRRRRRGAQGDRARHGVERKHHADRADAGAADGAAGESRGRRSRGVLADDDGGVGRSGRARACRTDAGRGVVCANHHQGPAVARPSRQRRTPGLRPRAVAVAAADARDRRAAAGLRPCAAGCRRGLRSAGGTADVAGARGRGARSVDGAGRARADVRPAQGGRLLRGDDAEQAVPGVGCGRAAARAWWRREVFAHGGQSEACPTIR